MVMVCEPLPCPRCQARFDVPADLTGSALRGAVAQSSRRKRFSRSSRTGERKPSTRRGVAGAICELGGVVPVAVAGDREANDEAGDATVAGPASHPDAAIAIGNAEARWTCGAKPLGTLVIPGETKLTRGIGAGAPCCLGRGVCSFVIVMGLIEGKGTIRRARFGPAWFLDCHGLAALGFARYTCSFAARGLASRCGFFEEGLFMTRGGELTAARWEDIPEYEISNETGRPLFLAHAGKRSAHRDVRGPLSRK